TAGSDVLVGVPLAGGQDTGIVYLFDGDTGTRRVTFAKPTALTGDFFGAAIVADGDDVLVGAPFDGAAAPSAGAAYLFRRATAVLERTLERPEPAEGDLFGAAVALDGGVALVGAPRADVGAENAGVVYVFARATGSLLRTLENPTPARGDEFGHALAAAGGRVLVGAQLDDTGGLDAGAAYL